ncbi:metalloregulator ArsR/SmtB family transcription factor [Patescibacteria group bacterium]|nr:metalloregulator ArsR/SmtB family transcription factor [Patescibacteria group bacterium]
MNMGSCNIKKLSLFLKLIGEESRLKILCVLKDGKICVCKIVETLSLSQSLVSHHLKDLKEAGLVEDEKKGQWVYYSLTSKGKRVANLILNIEKED